MRYVILEAIDDANIGATGLKIRGVREIDYPMVATEGRLIAHDLLEHQQGLERIGTIGDELIALGGVWYVRGQHNDIARHEKSFYSAHESVASDVVNMGRSYICGWSRLHAKVPSRAYSEARDDLSEVIDIAREQLPAELDGEEYEHEALERYLKFSLRLMCKGYNMARARFERHGRYYANELFWTIAEAVEPYAKYPEVGQQFRLAYGRGVAECRELWEDSQY